MQNPKLSRDEVARVALYILDDLGLPDLTMRRLASELGVGPSALYWYFPNKQTLLAELADRIVTSNHATVPADASWGEQLRAEALALRDALLAYRDSAEVVSSTLALGLGENPARTRLREALQTSPFTAESRQRAAAVLLHFILGHVSLEQQQLHYDSLGARSGEPVALSSASGAADFQFGIDTIIAGLRCRAPEPPTRVTLEVAES